MSGLQLNLVNAETLANRNTGNRKITTAIFDGEMVAFDTVYKPDNKWLAEAKNKMKQYNSKDKTRERLRAKLEARQNK